MRTLIVAAIGLAAAFAFAYAARAAHRSPASGALVFVACWFVFCGVDIIVGVRAGYALAEELRHSPAAVHRARRRCLGGR